MSPSLPTSTMNSRSALLRMRNETAFEAHSARDIRGELRSRAPRHSRRFDPFGLPSATGRYIAHSCHCIAVAEDSLPARGYRASARAGLPGPLGGTRPARTRSSSALSLSTACPLAHALATVLKASLTASRRSPKPASGRLRGSSPFDGSLRPDEPPDAGPLEQRQALRQRQELAPGKAGRYHRGNCPGCGSAPIEACREADGLRFVLGFT